MNSIPEIIWIHTPLKSLSKLFKAKSENLSVEIFVKLICWLLFGLIPMADTLSSIIQLSSITIHGQKLHSRNRPYQLPSHKGNRGGHIIKMRLLTVLKLGKSPTAELLSTGKDINGLISSEGCIIRVGVRTRAGRVVVWHVLPAKNKTKINSISCSHPSPSPT